MEDNESTLNDPMLVPNQSVMCIDVDQTLAHADEEKSLANGRRLLNIWACVHWGSVPLAMHWSFAGHANAVLGLAATVTGVSVYFDRKIMQSLIPSNADRVRSLGQPSTYMPKVPQWVFLLLMNLSGAPDEILDAGTLASAESVLSPEQRALWFRAWHKLPIVGATIAVNTASDVLFTILCVSLVVQVGFFVLWTVVDIRTQFATTLTVTKFRADIASLGMVSQVANNEGRPKTVSAFLTKVLCSNVWQLFISISVLALTWDDVPLNKKITNIGSIATGTASCASMAWESWCWGLHFIKETKPDRKGIAVLSTVYLAPSLMVAFSICVNVVRLCGIKACDSHIFNISEMSCVS